MKKMNFFECLNGKRFFNKNLGSSQRYTAFTLCEVLITLSIIGIIAEVTIPSIIQKQQEQQTVAKLKKVYSTLSSAYTLAVQENGTPDYWDLRVINDATGLANFNRIMTKNINVQKNCGLNPGCFYSKEYKDLNGINRAILDNSSGSSRIMLSDGTSVSFKQWADDCSWAYGGTPALKTVCGMIGVDINGAKSPNKYGFDYFVFFLTENALSQWEQAYKLLSLL